MYENLSEESKQGAKVLENAPLMKVYTSLLMSSFEQLMIVGKVGQEESVESRSRRRSTTDWWRCCKEKSEPNC